LFHIFEDMFLTVDFSFPQSEGQTDHPGEGEGGGEGQAGGEGGSQGRRGTTPTNPTVISASEFDVISVPVE